MNALLKAAVVAAIGSLIAATAASAQDSARDQAVAQCQAQARAANAGTQPNINESGNAKHATEIYASCMRGLGLNP